MLEPCFALPQHSGSRGEMLLHNLVNYTQKQDKSLSSEPFKWHLDSKYISRSGSFSWITAEPDNPIIDYGPLLVEVQ